MRAIERERKRESDGEREGERERERWRRVIFVQRTVLLKPQQILQYYC